MRDYGKVQSTFWTSDSTRKLSETGRMLALYLLTGIHTNQIGCFRLPDGYVCEDLGWTQSTVAKGFAELLSNGFATRDEVSKWVFIHKYLKWNIIENPNQAKSAERLFEQVPNESTVKPLLAMALRSFSERFNHSILDGFETLGEGLDKPFRNQEQEQYQEQEQKQEKEVKQKATAFDISKIILPNFIDQESWSSYVEMRKAKKKPISTERTYGLIIKDLTLWYEKGLDVNNSLDKSTKNGWTDVYEPKVATDQSHNGHNQDDGPVEQVNIADLPKAQKLADTTNAVDQSENKARMQEALRKAGVLNG